MEVGNYSQSLALQLRCFHAALSMLLFQDRLCPIPAFYLFPGAFLQTTGEHAHSELLRTATEKPLLPGVTDAFPVSAPSLILWLTLG
jgi:hypothetical protein